MTVQLVTSAAARPPCAPRAAACGCRGCPPGTLLSGSSGGGSRQNPDTTQHILLIKLSIISDKATWPCLVTQCLSTDSTLMVAAELVMDIFLLAASRNESLEAFWSMEHWTLNQNFKVSFSVFYFPHHIRKITRVAWAGSCCCKCHSSRSKARPSMF